MAEVVDTVELEALAASWVAMAGAATVEEIIDAAFSGLLGLIDVPIVYTAWREDGIWTILYEVGLTGDVAGVAVPEELVPYAEQLRAGETVCYESPEEMGQGLAEMLGAVGLASVYAMPIMNDTLCVGALVVGNRVPHHFTPRVRALVRLFTAHLSALIRKRELTQALETLAESVPVIVLRTDPSGWINWYNRRWFEFTGQTPEEAAGWGWQTAHHPVDFQRVIQEWPRALATGQPIEIEFRLRRYDGVYRWHLARVEPVRDDKGKIVSWYGTVIDIEEQKRALERTQRLADVLQTAFLPQHLPAQPEMRVDAHYVAAEQDSLVGGDWYDAFELPAGRRGVSIGDVAGHGVAASLAVGKVRQSIFTLAQQIEDPAAVLGIVNGLVQAQDPGTFVTAQFAVVDAGGTQLRYASAGHPPPLIARRAGEPAELLPAGGPPLGVVDDLELTTQTVEIERDAVVAFYTDGVTEFARDPVDGERRLRDVLGTLVGATSVARPAAVAFDLVVGSVAPLDDAALLVLQFSTIDVTAPTDEPVDTMQWRFHAADAQAAHVARGEVSAFLRRICGDSDDAFASELIVGELLANTVEHAPGLVHLIVEWTGERPVLIVRDSGPGLQALRTTLPDVMDEGSRGLFLAHALSAGVTLDKTEDGGAELRVVLPIRRSKGIVS